MLPFVLLPAAAYGADLSTDLIGELFIDQPAAFEVTGADPGDQILVGIRSYALADRVPFGRAVVDSTGVATVYGMLDGYALELTDGDSVLVGAIVLGSGESSEPETWVVSEVPQTCDTWAPAYDLTDAGTLGTSAFATGINEWGDFVGYSYVEGLSWHAFVSQDGVLTDLGTLGGTESRANDINSAGTIVGYAEVTGDTAQHAFIYRDGVMTDLGTLGGLDSSAKGINERGEVVGSADEPGFNDSHAFYYYDGIMTDLGTLGGWTSWANDINDRGEIVGGADVSGDWDWHAFHYVNGVMTDLGTLGGQTSYASAINDRGEIVGAAEIPGGQDHAFLYRDGVMIDLGTLGGTSSIAIDINEAGDIVGWSDPVGDGHNHGFLWRDGIMYDLGELTDIEGFKGGAIQGINNAGQLAGWRMEDPSPALGDSVYHGVFLDPIY